MRPHSAFARHSRSLRFELLFVVGFVVGRRAAERWPVLARDRPAAVLDELVQRRLVTVFLFTHAPGLPGCAANQHVFEVLAGTAAGAAVDVAAQLMLEARPCPLQAL